MRPLSETPNAIKFPDFFEQLKTEPSLPLKVEISEVEKSQMENWIWENIFRKERVGVPNAWLYKHMQRTSKVLETAGINTHDYEHVRTVMVNACLIFLSTQAVFLRDRYDLSVPENQSHLLRKLAIIAIGALFHDIGYLECIENENHFSKPDLDDHPKKGADIISTYGKKRIGRPLERAAKSEKAAQLVNQLLESLFQPPLIKEIKALSLEEFYKPLRKIQATISSHDSPEKQNGTDEAAKIDQMSAESICVYLADKTHIGKRERSGVDLETKEVIKNPEISVLHDRLTHLVTGESFSLVYGPEIIFKLNLEVTIPSAYRAHGYNELSFQQDFQQGFTKRYSHAQRVFKKLMHSEHLNNRPARFVVAVDFGKGSAWQMDIATPPQTNVGAFVRGMR